MAAERGGVETVTNIVQETARSTIRSFEPLVVPLLKVAVSFAHDPLVDNNIRGPLRFLLGFVRYELYKNNPKFPYDPNMY